MKFEPNTVYGSAGCQIYVRLLDDQGNVVPVKAEECVTFPSTERSSAEILHFEEHSFPVTIKRHEDGLKLILTGDYPAYIVYRDPETKATATINIHTIPPHNHPCISSGGPAVGAYEVFEI